MKGGKSVAESREPVQYLTITEEKALINWIIYLQKLGHPLQSAHIREIAEEILDSYNYLVTSLIIRTS